MTTPQPRNPLHGITLEAMVTDLVSFFGWEELGRRIPVRCFTFEPSVSSSLKFLRKTPWARAKVEGLYLFVQRERRRRRVGAARDDATIGEIGEISEIVPTTDAERGAPGDGD